MELLVFVYIAALLLLSIYGLHRSWMMWSLVRRPYQAPAVTETAEWPHVCVQLPIYNEARVVARLLAAVGEFDYPKDLSLIHI